MSIVAKNDIGLTGNWATGPRFSPCYPALVAAEFTAYWVSGPGRPLFRPGV